MLCVTYMEGGAIRRLSQKTSCCCSRLQVEVIYSFAITSFILNLAFIILFQAHLRPIQVSANVVAVVNVKILCKFLFCL